MPGLSYACTDEGVELPVIDLTHSAFEVNLSFDQLAALTASSRRRLRRLELLPTFVHRLMARRSILLRNAMGSQDSFYGGMATYLLKLGAANMHGVHEGRLDSVIASAIGPVSIRLRHRAASNLIAEGLAFALDSLDTKGRPVHLVNISGGPASDSLNALILLKKTDPARLADRRVAIRVLDLDAAGPRFGARSLDALQGPGGALEGLDASFDHHPYDWTDAAPLGRMIERSASDHAVVVGSSEGGLFEYADDDVILANLRALRHVAMPDFVMVGSYVRDEPAAQEIKRLTRATIRLFSPEAFEGLVALAGWSVVKSIENNPIYRVVALQPAPER